MARWLESEKADICDRFVRKGETATQIARFYQRAGKPEASRNAILGVLHRAGELGKGRSKIASQPSARVQALKSRASAEPAPALPADQAGLSYVAPVVIDSASASVFGRSASGSRRAGTALPIREVGETAVSLLQLETDDCRFPVGDPRPGELQLFCGKPKARGPYCVAHGAAAFDKPNNPSRRLERLASVVK